MTSSMRADYLSTGRLYTLLHKSAFRSPVRHGMPIGWEDPQQPTKQLQDLNGNVFASQWGHVATLTTQYYVHVHVANGAR